MDGLTPEGRSRLMSRVKQRDTNPEMKVRLALHQNGLRYRLHAKDLPGTPDIVFRSRRVAVFVHGCFWHGHGCRLSTTPKTRTEFWTNKISANQMRDHRQSSQLSAMGWSVVTIWQCQLKDMDEVVQRVKKALANA